MTSVGSKVEQVEPHNHRQQKGKKKRISTKELEYQLINGVARGDGACCGGGDDDDDDDDDLSLIHI